MAVRGHEENGLRNCSKVAIKHSFIMKGTVLWDKKK